MPRNNPANVRIKHAYFHYLREARRRNDASIDGVAKALSRFEESTGHATSQSFTANRRWRSSASWISKSACAVANG
jgi:hypothetical protein